jgi:hypothetical protein
MQHNLRAGNLEFELDPENGFKTQDNHDIRKVKFFIFRLTL